MSKRKTILTLAATILTFATLTPVIVSAQYVLPNPSKYNTVEDVINALGGVVRTVVVVVFIISLMYGGWVRLTAQADSEKIARSQKIMVAAAVGFAIIVLAPVIVDFVGRLVGVQGSLINFATP